jgi:hypothetical protein
MMEAESFSEEYVSQNVASPNSNTPQLSTGYVADSPSTSTQTATVIQLHNGKHHPEHLTGCLYGLSPNPSSPSPSTLLQLLREPTSTIHRARIPNTPMSPKTLTTGAAHDVFSYGTRPHTTRINVFASSAETARGPHSTRNVPAQLPVPSTVQPQAVHSLW